jgi:hypothetical protein
MASDDPITYHLRGAPSEASDDTKEELRILRALAAGKHPLTGISLPDESCYQSAKVVRALFAAIKALEKSPRLRKLPLNTGKPWSAEDDVELGKCYDQGMTILELARKYERTSGGISSRLEKLGKIKVYAPVGNAKS